LKTNLGDNGNGTYTELRVSDDEIISRDVMPGQYVQNILDVNSRFRAEGRQPNRNAHGRLAASIPLPIYTEWRKSWMTKYKDDWSWKTYLTMKINSRDYSHLKTNEMNV
jgi:hypothetical protein